jgi:hypothetical protein
MLKSNDGRKIWTKIYHKKIRLEKDEVSGKLSSFMYVSYKVEHCHSCRTHSTNTL